MKFVGNASTEGTAAAAQRVPVASTAPRMAILRRIMVSAEVVVRVIGCFGGMVRSEGGEIEGEIGGWRTNPFIRRDRYSHSLISVPIDPM